MRVMVLKAPAGGEEVLGFEALTGCEGISPKTGEDCDDPGIVCPSELGSCVCQSRRWECFEIGGNEAAPPPPRKVAPAPAFLATTLSRSKW